MKRKNNEKVFVLHCNGGAIAMVSFTKSYLVSDVERNFSQKWPVLKEKGYSIVRMELVPVKKKSQ